MSPYLQGALAQAGCDAAYRRRCPSDLIRVMPA